MDLAETVATLFERKSPGVFVYRRRMSLLTSRAAVVPVVLIGLVAAGAVALLARNRGEGAILVDAVLAVEIMFLKQMELEIDCGARRVIRRWSLPGSGALFTRRQQVVEGDYAQYFVPEFASGPGRFHHELMIVRGRKRYGLLWQAAKDREVIPTLDRAGHALAGLLGIEYRGVESNPGFFWW
jgi:hypothetical protein